MRGIESRTDFSHISEMFEDTKKRSELYPFFHIAPLNDFGSFALWMSGNLFESAHCSTAIRCCVSPEVTVAVEISYYDVRLDSLSQWRERNGSGGGLYRECTTPGSSTVINSTFSSSHTEMLFTFRPCLRKTEIPCLLCGRSATSVKPGIFGLWLGVFLGDIDSGNAVSCTILIVWMFY